MGRLIRFGDPENPLYEFRKREIVSIKDDKQTTLIGDELKIDTLTPVVRFTVLHPDPLTDSLGVPLVDVNGEPLVGYGTGDIRIMPHGTKATLYEVYGDEETLKAVYFVDDVERIAKDQYQINCVSIIGRLEEQKWIGQFFYSNKTISEVIQEIVGNSIPWQISLFLANYHVYGYIPNCTKREALYHLMLGCGMGIYNDRGTLIFRPVGEVGNAEIIPDDRIYINGKVTYPKPPSSVQVTAHSWDYLHPGVSMENRVVFDNTQTLVPANNDVISVDFVYTGFDIQYVDGYEHLHTDFDDDPQLSPLKESRGEFTIQSGYGKLTLHCPTRTDTVVEITNPDAEVERVVSVTDEMMISPYNVQNVANRLMDYYKNGKIIENSIVLDHEICGQMYEFNNTFGEPESAAMTSMQTVYSGVTKANCKLVSGLDMTVDFPYTNYDEYSTSQTIDLRPLKEQGIHEIAVLLVGGGQAGFDGEDGEDGENTEPPASGDYIKRGGKGGEGGKGGHGGKAKLVRLSIDGIDELILTCGAGGTSDGEEGGVTSIQYTDTGGAFPLTVVEDTADGEIFSIGTYNPLSGQSYGEKGEDGISGGDGGDSGRIWAAKVINGDEFQWDDGQQNPDGSPKDVSSTVAAHPGQAAKAGNSLIYSLQSAGGDTGSGNYGTNILWLTGYYTSESTGEEVKTYYSYGGPGGGGGAYGERGRDAEAVYTKR